MSELGVRNIRKPDIRVKIASGEGVSMDRKQAVTITNMCMVYQGNQVLVLDKVNSEWNGITFPGGHVERQESFTDAVIREVLEETGLTIRMPQLCGIKDWVEEDGSRYMVLFYKTDKFQGELKSSAEGKVFWIEQKKLPELDLSLDFLDMLKVFLEPDLSEFFYYLQDGRWCYDLK